MKHTTANERLSEQLQGFLDATAASGKAPPTAAQTPPSDDTLDHTASERLSELLQGFLDAAAASGKAPPTAAGM